MAARSGGRRAGIAAGAVLGAVVVVVAASFVVGRLDASALKPRIEAAFERATGRTLRIGGTLRFTLLPSPGFVADDVSIANLPGGTGPDMVVARTVSARVDLLGLLERDVHVQSVALSDPEILLETVDGLPNWRLRPRTVAGRAGGTSSPRAPFRFDLGEIAMRGGDVVWHGLGRAGSGAVSLDDVHAQQQDRSSFTLFAAARHGETFFTLSLAAAPPERFFEHSGESLPLRAKLTLGHDENGDRIDIAGTVTPGGGFDGRIHAALAQMADLDGLFPHAHLPELTDLRLQATGSVTPGGRWSVRSLQASGLQAELGRLGSRLTLDRFVLAAAAPDAPLSVDTAGSFRGVPFWIKGVAGSPDLISQQIGQAPVDLAMSSLADRGTFRGVVSRAPSGAGSLTGHASLSVPDPAPLRTVLQVKSMPALAADGELALSERAGLREARFEASSLSIGSANLPPSLLTASLATPGNLLVQAAFGAAPPWLTWRENLTAPPRRASLTLDGHDLPAGPLSTLMTGRPVVSGRLTVRATLEADAIGPRLDPRTLDGPVTATLLDAEIDSAVTRDVLGRVLHAARLPRFGDGQGRLQCVTGTGTFTNGVLALGTFSLEAPLVTMTGSGRIDLPGGSLDLQVEPVMRLGATDISTEIALTGAIAAPNAALAAQRDGRFGIRIGRLPAVASCRGGAPAARKPAKPADILRALGILR